MHLFLYGAPGMGKSALIREVLAEQNILPFEADAATRPGEIPAGSVVLAGADVSKELFDAPVRIVGAVDGESLPEALLHPQVTVVKVTEETRKEAEAALRRHLAFPRLSEVLGIQPGITAIVGGGGKTTTMLKLANELSAGHTCIVGTTTNIFSPELPTLIDPTEESIRAALREHSLICVGTPAKMGKLGAVSEELLQKLPSLAEYVILEADGSKGLPLKAPAAHEPVLPENTKLVVALAGMDGANKPIREVCHRPERYAELLGTELDHTVTPAEIAKVLAHRNGQYKNVTCAFTVILNKSDSTERFRAARGAAAAFPGTAIITAMQRDPAVYEIWRNGTCLW